MIALAFRALAKVDFIIFLIGEAKVSQKGTSCKEGSTGYEEGSTGCQEG